MAKQYKSILESLLEDLERQGKKGYKLNFTDDRMVMNLPPEARPPRKYDVNQGLQEIGGPPDILQESPYDQDPSEKNLKLMPSSTIANAIYYPEIQYLIVSFKSGSSYSYEDVPFAVMEKWERAPSAGSFFYYNIRKSFAYQKV